MQGAGGIGFGIYVAPILALTHPELVPGPMLMLGGLVSLFAAAREFHAIDFRGAAFALVGRGLAAFPAAMLISVLPLRATAIVFALLILLGVACSVAGWRIETTPRNLFVAGLLSGAMGTITSVGTPVIAIVYQYSSPERLRATIGAFLVVGSVLSIAALASFGRFGMKELEAGLALVLPMVVGFALSNTFMGLLDRRRMRLFVLSLSTLAAVLLIVQQML